MSYILCAIVSLQTSTPLFSTNQCELRHTALMFGQITALLDYINSALKSMYEAWEDLLITMESKLAAYATVSTPPPHLLIIHQYIYSS